MSATDEAATPERLPLSRNVRILGGVSFLTDASSEMLYPVIPLYLTEALGAPVAAVGLVEGLAEATANVVKGLSGRLADRLRRRRPFVIAGYALGAAAKPLMALAGSWPGVLGARLIDRTGKGLRGPARDAIIVESTPAADRGRAFGWHRAADTWGAVLGPLLGLALLGWGALSYSALFWIATVPALAGVVLLWAVREPRPAKPSDASIDSKGARIASALPATAEDQAVRAHALRRFLVVIAIFSLGNSSNAFLLLRARDLGWSGSSVVGLYVLFNIAYALAAAPAGRLSDRYGRRRVLALGLTTAAVVYGGFALADSSWWAALLLPAYGVYAGAFGSAGRALVADLAPPDGLAGALGAYQLVSGLGVLLASLVAGGLWDAFGAWSPFAFGATTSLLALAGLAAVPPVTVPEKL